MPIIYVKLTCITSIIDSLIKNKHKNHYMINGDNTNTAQCTKTAKIMVKIKNGEHRAYVS